MRSIAILSDDVEWAQRFVELIRSRGFYCSRYPVWPKVIERWIQKPNLVILDTATPRPGHGWRMFKYLKKNHGFKIILVGELETRLDIEKIPQSKLAEAYFQKPVDTDAFWATVDIVLRKEQEQTYVSAE